MLPRLQLHAVRRVHRLSLRPLSGYAPQAVEAKWRARVAAAGAGQRPSSSDPALYYLAMFPYPSGALHMGHVRVYTIPDAMARFQRLNGRRVIVPMGWDAFGLPAENAAVDRGLPPSDWTYSNIASMKAQLTELGLSLDWDREITTCHPSYYKWTQWLFLQLHKHGLVYRANATVNWDPVDKTVLANEQVDSQGRSWRSGAIVEKRTLQQWFIRITAMAEDLLGELDNLQWPKSVVEMQRNWIGRSSGAEIRFEVDPLPNVTCPASHLSVFTTQPETFFGATFIALNEQHPLAPLAGQLRVRHPLRPGQSLPVVVAPYIVAGYGTSAVMGVPGHDARDLQFAQANGLPVISVVDEAGQKMVNSGPLDGLTVEDARQKMCVLLQQSGTGEAKNTYRLHDWLVSRQRYWGTPIPMVHCDSCGVVPVPEDQLPVTLPLESQVNFVGAEGSPLSTAAESWLHTSCPQCNGRARRDTDTLDTFVDSSWYYLRYLDSENEKVACNPKKAAGMPVDLYVGGIEHAVLHLLYARFFCRFMHDIGLSPVREPFKELLTQGMVQGRTHRSSVDQRYLRPEQLAVSDNTTVEKATGLPTLTSWEKMSKSKYNGVLPEDIVREFGTDTMRVFILFKAPPDIDLEWDADAVRGVSRWLARVWNLVQRIGEQHTGGAAKSPKSNVDSSESNQAVVDKTNWAIDKIQQAFLETRSLNVAVAALMELSNSLRGALQNGADPTILAECARSLLVMMVPFAPHLAAELWEQLQAVPSKYYEPKLPALEQKWPSPLPAGPASELTTMAVQLKGKIRGQIQLPRADTQNPDKVLAAAMGHPELHELLASHTVKRVILAPNGRLVSIVI